VTEDRHRVMDFSIVCDAAGLSSTDPTVFAGGGFHILKTGQQIQLGGARPFGLPTLHSLCSSSLEAVNAAWALRRKRKSATARHNTTQHNPQHPIPPLRVHTHEPSFLPSHPPCKIITGYLITVIRRASIIVNAS